MTQNTVESGPDMQDGEPAPNPAGGAGEPGGSAGERHTAAGAGVPGKQAEHSPTGDDGRTRSAGGVNRCQCCQQVLPEQKGRSRPRKYCADGTGRYEARYGMTCAELGPALEKVRHVFGADRTSTRLNSSHVKISYAV